MSLDSRRAKLVGLCLWTGLLLWGCAPSRSQQEIPAAFRTFLSDVRAGDLEKVRRTAPFLDRLSSVQRATALRSFQRLAAVDPGSFHMEVSRGSGETWLLRVSVSDTGSAPARGALIVPFQKNARGEWEMSPVIEAVQHIDVVPAR